MYIINISIVIVKSKGDFSMIKYLSVCVAIIFAMIIFGDLVADETSSDTQSAEQREEEFQNQLRKKLEEDRKAMEELLQSDDFGMLQKRMQQLMQSFGAFDDLNIHDFFGQGLSSQGLGTLGNNAVETWWEEKGNEKILFIKAQKNKDDPFNITVEKGMININGTKLNEVKDERGRVIQKSYSSISSSQQIPSDVDPDSVRYDQDKQGNIMIIFKKVVNSPSPDKKPSQKNGAPSNSFQPLKPNEDDERI